MKKYTMIWMLFALSIGTAMAQKKTTAPKKTEEVTVTVTDAKGAKAAKGTKDRTVIVIENGAVTINGQPASTANQRIVIGDSIIINGKGMVMAERRAPMMRLAKPQAFLGLATEKNEKGAAVTEVVEGSAAAKAGLKTGDIITKINGEKITDAASLSEAVRKNQPNDEIDIAYLRQDKEEKVKATLGKTDNAMAMNMENEEVFADFQRMAAERQERLAERQRVFSWKSNDLAPANAPDGFNFQGQEGPVFRYGQQRPRYGMGVEDNADGDGAKVSTLSPGSQAEKAGMKIDDIITAVEDQPVKTVDDLRELLAQGKDKTAVNITVLRNGKSTSLRLLVPKVIKKAEL